MSKSRKIHPVAATKPGAVVRSRTVASPPLKDNLLRLPHIFAKVLTLPFHADAPVSLSETRCSLRFSVPARDVVGGVVAEPIEIYPGVVKVVLRARDGVVWGEELDICAWRFRLPDSTQPEMASASCVDGELVVVVPKIIDDGAVGGGGRDRLLLVNRRLK